MTTTDILTRCYKSPSDHLAATALSQFLAYSLGYELHAALTPEDFNNHTLTSAITRDYAIQEAWPSNLSSTGFLIAAEGEERALSKYLHYRTSLAKPINEKDAPPPFATDDLFRFLSAPDALRKRPRMYLGNEARVSHVWSLISGHCWAEIDTSGKPGKACAFQTGFQRWIEERFPFSKGIPWHRTLYFLSLSSAEISLKTFFDHFDLFQAGESPGCPSITARTIMDSIKKGCGYDPTDIEETIKRIAPI